jgi:hypothetical protein
MTGYSEYSRGDSGKGFPDAPILQKPFSPASLVGIVREALWGVPQEHVVLTEESRMT